MSKYNQIKISNHNINDVFAVVADIEKYPEFLPWCRVARILERGEDFAIAELVIAFKGMRESYISKISFDYPNFIFVEQKRGVFKHLTNIWKFKKIDINHTEIDFFIDFEFNSFILNKMIGIIFGKASEKMADAFEQRLDLLKNI